MTTQENSTEHVPGRVALMIAHCAGMVDLVALPVWVGALITRYGYDPQHAGALVTLFLLGAVVSSLFWAPRFHSTPVKQVAAFGFGIAGAAFLALTQTSEFAPMAVLHAIAGIAAGSALSVTHGTIGRSARPHRLFAMAGLALAAFGIAFLGVTPGLVAANGGPALFKTFCGVMLIAAVTSWCAFPSLRKSGQHDTQPAGPLSTAVWFAAIGVGCMGLVQAMIFSFMERIGADRGYAAGAITAVLIALGLVNLTAAPLAALLESRWQARLVVIAGPVVQAALALTITQSSEYAAYAGASACFAAVMIFTHTFAFGFLAQLDPAGRALSATPAMLMIGAAVGPVLGGTLVQQLGYASLSSAAVLFAVIAVCCFARAGRVIEPVLT